jgi:hypothetical protein
MPYCPSCGVRVAPGAARCGLDGSLLRLVECPGCGGEVGLKDQFCGHCRFDLRHAPPRLRPVEMLPAPWTRRLGAAGFDALGTLLAVQGFLPILAGWQQLIVAWLLVPLWVSLVEVQDGMSPGQQIFSLKRLRSDGQSLALADYPRALAAAAAFWLGPRRAAGWSRTSLFWVPQ